MKETGLIHIYCGDGKGKTTAAIGLAVRHAGFGGKVVLAQFLKDGTSSECRALAKLGNITMLAANPSSKFSFQMTEEEKQECSAAIGRTFAAATGFAVREGATLLVLDEVCARLRGFLPRVRCLRFWTVSRTTRGCDDRPRPVRSPAGACGLHHGNGKAPPPV